MEPVSYAEAMSIIIDNTGTVDQEKLPLSHCYGRIPFAGLSARYPEPAYDQSQRDGYAVGRYETSGAEGVLPFSISTEIPAGRSDDISLAGGEACRIMTGALLPSGAVAVIPQEVCRVEGGKLLVSTDVLKTSGSYIQKKGSVIKEGTLIVEPGTRLGPSRIGLLAATGVRECMVYRKVRVGLFCSGSELVGLNQKIEPGKKVSSNRYLLDSLIRSCNAIPVDCGVAVDDPRSLSALLSEIAERDVDIIISTGGLGPGKYDLLESVFSETGGRLYYRSLRVRPGKATLFGTIKGKLYFGLPGPPPAVRILFNEFVVPVLKKMSGLSSFAHRDRRVILAHDVEIRSGGMHFLREGVTASGASGTCVRFASDLEEPDCTVMLPEGMIAARKGETVTVHKITPGHGW
jgi:molybdopterin molybdotransferase